MSPQRRILYLDAGRPTIMADSHPRKDGTPRHDCSTLTAWRLAGKRVEPEAVFAVADGLEAFGEYLRARKGSLFYLLADCVEEGFQIEDIPRSGGKDRAAIVRRKLGQYFYGTPFALARSLGRLPSGRRDERLLLMALTQPQHLEPWLDAMRQAGASLCGIYSAPQLAHLLLPAAPPDKLLLIMQTAGGLRQTFFVAGRLRFSHLSPLATGRDEEAAAAVAGEAGKLHQYLAGQRLLERDRPLPTRVLAPPAQFAALREHCRDSALLRYEWVDLTQEAGRLGLAGFPADGQADRLLCHLLARNTPAEQFAPPAERGFYRLWQARFAFRATAAVVLVAGLLFAAHTSLDVMQVRTETAGMFHQAELDQRRYDAALRALPQIPLSIDNLRALVDRYDQVARRAEGPAPLLVQLSRSLDAFPEIFVEDIQWEIVEQLVPPPGVAMTAVPPALRAGPHAEVTVLARLPVGMAGNRRALLDLTANFVKHLETAPDRFVLVLQSPVDTESGKTLKSGDPHRPPEAPHFSFRLTRKLR